MANIDAHTHLDAGRFDPAILGLGDLLGIDKFVCSNIGNFVLYPTFEAVREMNQTTSKVVAAHPDRLAGYCTINPRHGRRGLDNLRECFERDGLIGVKLWVATLADDPIVDPFVELATKWRAPVLVHAWRKTVGQLPYESTAVHVARLAGRHPDARIIMAHLGGQVETAINIIAGCRNVRVDTSGTIIGAGAVALAVKRLGSHRVVFGSDLPHVCLAANVGKVLGAGLDDEARRLVMGGNMARLLAEVTR